MKVLISFCCLFITAVTGGNNAQDKTKQAVLTGKIENIISNEIRLGNSVIAISKDGTFKFDLEVEKPSFYDFNYADKKTELFISPGDSLYISFNANDFFPSFNITGVNADLNMFLLGQEEMDTKVNQYLNNNSVVLCSADPAIFTAKIDSLKDSFMNRLDDFLKNKNNVNSWFVKKNRAEIIFGFNGFKLVYPCLHKRFTGKAAIVDSNYYDNLARDAFNDPELLQAEAYNRFLDIYLDIQAAGKYRYDDFYRSSVNIKGATRYRAIQDLKANKEITRYLILKYFESYLGNYGITGLEGTLAKFKNDCTDNELKEKVLQLYNKKIQERKEAGEIRIYKRIGDIQLEAHIFYPDGFRKEDKHPAFLFFHGGGWSTGMPEWGYRDCKRYASRGMVAITFEYRLMEIYGNKIVDCVKDAKSAVYWVRSHAGELGIDTGKIVAAGFSAGAHLAACTAILDDYEDPGNDPKISCKPNALILGSASYSTEEWFNASSGTDPESISPFHQLKKNLVPTIMFHGKKDEIVPYEKQFVPFIEKMKSLNNKFTYYSFDDLGHFYFRDPKAAEISEKMTEDFLISIGYIKQLNQEKKSECLCLQSKIRFDDSSIEKIVLHPEDLLVNPDSFWESDSAYRLVKIWHQRVSLPVSMEQWKGWLQPFINQSAAEREKNTQLLAAKSMMKNEKEFNEKAIPYICSFLPQNCPDISTTIYFTTAIMASAFQMENNIVIYGANADKDNLFIHELFHQGFNKCKPKNLESSSKDSVIYQMYNDLQNEGMATYVGYMGLKEFPHCRTDMLKDDYKLFEDREELDGLLNKMNEIFKKAMALGEKELKDALWQVGSMDRAYYVAGCYMAKTIDEKLGRNTLVATISKGPRHFLSTYNSLADEKLRVFDLYYEK